MSKLKIIQDYLKYYFNASTRHGVHSPFLFKILDEAVYGRDDNEVYDRIEKQRKSLLRNKTKLTLHEMGGRKHGRYQTRICDVVKDSARQKKYCTLIYRLVRYFKPQIMIELGTSFGISTMYQSAGNNEGIIYTIEGNSLITTIANEYFKDARFKNIKTITGNFDDRLPELINKVEKIDWLFFDGNHRKEPTMKYFEMALPKLHNNSVLLIDDINWSQQMKDAWNEIKNHPAVTASFDFFLMGMVLFNPDLSKEHFVIRY